MKQQKLSEEAIKRLDLENAEQSIEERKEAVPVKEWNNYKDYLTDEFEDCHNDEKWYEKVKDFFVYTIGHNVRDWWIDTRWYFSNLKRFQPMIKSWRSWDYRYQIDLFVFGLKQLTDTLERYGHEEDVSRNKKIAAIRSLIAEIELDYQDVVEKRFSSMHNYFGKIIKYSDGSVSHICADEDAYTKDRERYHAALKKARKTHYDKIFKLIVGQDDDKINQIIKDKYEALSEEEKKEFDFYTAHVELFDGSGIEGWWD